MYYAGIKKKKNPKGVLKRTRKFAGKKAPSVCGVARAQNDSRKPEWGKLKRARGRSDREA
jgi:hypothetical protein